MTSEVAGSYNSSLLSSPSPGNDEPGERKASSRDRTVSTNEAPLPPGVLAQLHSLSGHALSSSSQLDRDSSASTDAIAGIFSLPVFAAPTFSGGGSSSVTTAGVSYGSGVVDDGRQSSASTPPCGESSGSSRYRDHEGCPVEDRGMNGCSRRGDEGHWGSLALEDQMQSLMSDMDKAMSRFRVDPTGAWSDDIPTVTCLSHLTCRAILLLRTCSFCRSAVSDVTGKFKVLPVSMCTTPRGVKVRIMLSEIGALLLQDPILVLPSHWVVTFASNSPDLVSTSSGTRVTLTYSPPRPTLETSRASPTCVSSGHHDNNALTRELQLPLDSPQRTTVKPPPPPRAHVHTAVVSPQPQMLEGRARLSSLGLSSFSACKLWIICWFLFSKNLQHHSCCSSLPLSFAFEHTGAASHTSGPRALTQRNRDGTADFAESAGGSPSTISSGLGSSASAQVPAAFFAAGDGGVCLPSRHQGFGRESRVHSKIFYPPSAASASFHPHVQQQVDGMVYFQVYCVL